MIVKDKGRRIAICHCCGLSMLPWKLQLGPWEAHALLRNFCKYLEVRKGPKYILDITKVRGFISFSDLLVMSCHFHIYKWC